MDIYFGDPSECDAFVKSHSEFFKRVRDLESLLRRAFVRSFTTGSLADKVIFFLGNLCVEDFNEILLLCGNGCGSGGLKILRGMYEKCVTAGFLASLPGAEREQEAQEFVDWHHIDNWKLWNRVQDAYKDRQLLTLGRIAQMKAEYERVKKTLPPPCQKCGRGQISWSKLDLFPMARTAGSELVELYPTCYREPTLHIHVTSSAVYRRLKLTSDDELSFNGAPQRDAALWALSGAHALILLALALQIRHFKLDELAEDKERVFADYQTVWGRRPGGIEPG